MSNLAVVCSFEQQAFLHGQASAARTPGEAHKRDCDGWTESDARLTAFRWCRTSLALAKSKRGTAKTFVMPQGPCHINNTTVIY